MYLAAHGIEVAGNVFGRQGYPLPLFRTQALGADTGLPGAGDTAHRHVRLRERVGHGPSSGQDVQGPHAERAGDWRPVNVLNATRRSCEITRAVDVVQCDRAEPEPRIFRAGLVVGF